MAVYLTLTFITVALTAQGVAGAAAGNSVSIPGISTRPPPPIAALSMAATKVSGSRK